LHTAAAFNARGQGDERVELMRQLAEHIAEARRERQATLQDEEPNPIVHPRVEVPGPFQLFITPPA
jgi:predicted small metal-binding protein